MKLLLISYSFGAWRGSEAGVGWNVAKGLCERGHDVTVVTTTEFAHINHPAIAELGLPLTLHEWDYGITQFASARSYRHWQNCVGQDLRRLCHEEQYDLAHHVTFNQYRDIKDVFATGLPYVIGPVGGAETVHPVFWGDLPAKVIAKEMLRYVPLDVHFLAQRVHRSEVGGVVLASGPQTYDRLRRYGKLPHVELMPIIAVRREEVCAQAPTRATQPYVVFDGGTRPEKGLRMLLRVMGRMWHQGDGVPIKVAAVPAASGPGILTYAASQGVPPEGLELMPFMPRADLLRIMQESSGFVSVGFRDSGCMALLEALAMGVPCLCLDTGGQHWLPVSFAEKVPVGFGVESALQAALQRLILSGAEKAAAQSMQRAAWLREQMSWESRLDQFELLYKRVLNGEFA